MKKYFFFLMFLHLSVSSLSAQLLSSFPQDSATWKISYTCSDDGVSFLNGWEVITIAGDTIIDGENYIELVNDTGSDFFFVRIAGDKVYFKYTDFPTDTAVLIHDFGLEENDVFFYPDFLFGSLDVTIEAIDTVEFADGIKRKRLKLSEPYDNICGSSSYWIEGIGSAQIPFYFRNCFECKLNGFEFWSKGEMIFNNVIVSTEEVTQTHINISPNPVSTSFIIEGDFQSLAKVTLCNIVGKEIISQVEITNGLPIELPQDIPSGLYILKITINETETLSEKILVE